jgi:DNA-binding SARP family transcriptional activator
MRSDLLLAREGPGWGRTAVGDNDVVLSMFNRSMATLPTDHPPQDEPAATHPIRISVLGRVQVVGAEGRDGSADFGRGVVRSVLALAASSRQGVARDELTDALWPRHHAQAARNRLHHTVHLARRALSELAWPDEWIVIERARLSLDSRIWCDAWQLEDAARSTPETLSTASVADALRLCQGEWAPEVEASGLGQSIRRQLHEANALLRVEMARRLGADGDTPALREALQSVIDLNETDEWAHVQLMQLDLHAGRHHSVLRRFESLGKTLALRLGLRPSRQASEIAAQAARQIGEPVSVEPAVGVAMPSSGGPLLGRESLLRTLCGEITAGPGVWNVTGMTGVGKSALMREVMRRTAPLLVDGVVYVPQEQAYGGLVAEVVRAAGLRGQARGTGELLARLLEEREALLVLDDVDQAADVSEMIALLARPLKARVVLISSFALEAGPVPFRAVQVPPLGVALAGAPLSQARLSPAVALFQSRRPSLQERHPGETELREVVALVEELGGLPLAIELAAAQTDTRTPGEILAQVRGGGGLMPAPASRLATPKDAGPRTMQDSLDVFVGLIDPIDQRLYQVVSVFATPFDVDAVQALCERAGLEDPARLVAALPRLARSGLVEARPGTGNFRMLLVPRAHARGMARGSGLWNRLERAHVDALIEHLETGAVGHESPLYADWLLRVRRREDEALAQLEAAGRIGDAHLVRLASPLFQALAARGQGLAVFQWCEVAIQASVRLGDSHAELSMRTFASIMLLAAQRADEALAHARAAERLVGEDVDPELSALAVATLAQAINAAGGIEEALDVLRGWIQVHPRPAQRGFWTIFAAMGRLRKSGVVPALESLGTTLPPLGVLRARFAGSLLWRHLLVALATLNHDPAARLDLADEMVAAGRRMDSAPSVIGGLYFRVQARLALGQSEEAGRDISEWYRLARDSGDRVWASAACMIMVDFAWRLGDLDRADTWLGEARLNIRPDEPGEQRRFVLLHETVVAVLRGDQARASRAFVEAVGHHVEELRLGSLEGAIEAGALLARLMGLEDIAGSLATHLALLSPAQFNPLAITRFRERHLAPRPSPAMVDHGTGDGASLESVASEPGPDEVSARARADIASLLKAL